MLILVNIVKIFERKVINIKYSLVLGDSRSHKLSWVAQVLGFKFCVLFLKFVHFGFLF